MIFKKFIFPILCLFFVMGCERTDDIDNLDTTLISVSFAGSDTTPHSRISYTPNGNKYNFAWSVGDKISLIVPEVKKNENLEFVAKSASKSSKFDGYATAWSGRKSVFSLFPYKSTPYLISGSSDISTATVRLSTIGQEITIGANNRYENSYMVAAGANATIVDAKNHHIPNLHFKQVMSILKINVANISPGVTITEIGMNTDTEEFISVADILFSDGTIAGTPTKVKTISAKVLGVNSGSTTEVNLAIFPIDITDKNMNVFVKTLNSNGATKVYEIQKEGINFERNYIYDVSFVLDSEVEQPSINIEGPNPLGIYRWFGVNVPVPPEYTDEVFGTPLIYRWNQLEPTNNEFKFDKIITPQLQKFKREGVYTFLMIWVAPLAPEWLYENGVPKVEFDPNTNPLGEVVNHSYQYYLDEDHKFFYYRLISEFGAYIKSLPDDLRETILFVQSAEGSTGDGNYYKGKLIDSKYKITPSEWEVYRIAAWEQFKKALTTEKGEMIVPLAVNFDFKSDVTNNWLIENLDCIGLKKGDFSHGYHISEMNERISDFNEFVDKAESLGKKVFTRGEQDAEWETYGWSKNNPEQAFYWSGIFATHCGLDMWNIPHNVFSKLNILATTKFFNKYASHRDPTTAPAAFCALRKGLNAMDVESYPESVYGYANRSNTNRYIKIAEAYKKYGALQQDPEKATQEMMDNRKREGYNDVGWDILPSNYCRFLEQIDEEETSVGWWNLDKTIYGRFARGFEKATDKTAMYFKLNENFFSNKGAQKVNIKVIYLDKGTGSWSLSYATTYREKSFQTVVNSDSGEWKTAEFSAIDALFNQKLDRGSDLILKQVTGDDVIFHMIEVNR